MRPIVWTWCFVSLAALFLLTCQGVSQAASPGQTPKVTDFFTPEQIARGKAYRFENRVVYFISLGIQVGALIVLLTTGAGGWLRDFVSRMGGHRPYLSALLLSASVLVLLSAVSLPVSLYSGYFHEHAYGMSAQRLPDWFLDYGKSLLVTVAVFVPVGLALWALIRRFPEVWWLPAWGGAGAGTLVLVFIAPILIDPIFHSFRPIQDRAFRERAVRLAERAGIRVQEVLEMDASRRTRHVNAYFTGLGRTKRIVIYDTLLRGSTPEEAELILAHEMGHWRHDHIYKGIGLSLIGTLVVLLVAHRAVAWAVAGERFGLSGGDDPLALVLVLLLVTALNFLSLPIQNAVSRSFEREADVASLTLTDRPDAFVEAEKKLAAANLDDVEPWWGTYYLFYTHPSTLERIGMALNYKNRGQGSGVGDRVKTTP